MNKAIFCTLEVEGLHHWSDCDIEEVSYLKNLHRHMFGITAYKSVTHSNRDIEFIKLKHEVKDYLCKYYQERYECLNFGNMSCEDIAIKLIKDLDLIACEVTEDGENGAMVSL